MPIYNGKKFAQEKLLDIAAYCIHACLKAPQITGKVELQFEIVTGADLEPIFEALSTLARVDMFNMLSAMNWQKAYFAGEPPVLLLLGGKGVRRSELNWNCGACGFRSCKEFNQYSRKIEPTITSMIRGPVCMWKLIDYGTACDWACAQAWLHNITNRIEIASGWAARAIGYLPECEVIHGLPLGPMEDMFWYSRPVFTEMMDYQMWKDTTMLNYPMNWGTFPGHGRPTIKYGQKWWETTKDRTLVDSDIATHEEIKKGVIADLDELKQRVEIHKKERE